MYKSRLSHKVILAFLAFYLTLALPLIFIVFSQSDYVSGLTIDQYITKMHKTIIGFSVLAFFSALVFALFFIRGILRSARNLHDGVTKMRKGETDVSLHVYSTDELGEVTEAFNEMSSTIHEYTEELKKKDLYINTMLDPLWVFDIEDLVIDINPAFTVLLGYEKADAVGMCLYEFFDEKNRKILQTQAKNWEKMLSHTFEVEIKNIYNTNIPVLISIAPVLKDKKMIGKVGVFKDFRAQRALRENMSNIILDCIPDGVYTVNMEKVITAMNSAAEKILGVPKNVAIGRPCSKVIIHTDQEGKSLCDQCPMSIAMKGEAIRIETTLQIGGRLTSLLITCSPLFAPDGKITGAVQVFRDISEEKEIEQMKTDFVESVSHEFRTPLSAIVGMTEMLMDDAVKGHKKDEYLNTIYSEALRLSDMVSQLLDISTTEHGHIHFERVLIDLNALISLCISTYETKKTVKDKGAIITFADHRKDAALHPFFGDKNRLKQVIINLLDNAVTYSDDGVRVAVELNTQNKNTIISIKDSGWGVPPEDMQHIFKRFYRGRHSRILKGTGLGLPLCEEIVKLHGGTITVESELGRGSEFVLTFPALEGS